MGKHNGVPVLVLFILIIRVIQRTPSHYKQHFLEIMLDDASESLLRSTWPQFQFLTGHKETELI